MAQIPTVLFLLSRTAMIGDANVLAGAMLRSGRFRVIYVFSGELLVREVERQSDETKPFVFEDRTYRVAPRGIGRLGPLRLIYLLWRFFRRGLAVRNVISSLRPNAVVVFEDRILDPETIWLSQLHRAGIPAILVRYASSSAESDFWGRIRRGIYSVQSGMLSPFKRAFAKGNPKHVLRQGNESLLFYPLWDSIALMLAGMADFHPWVAGGGYVARVALQGGADRLEAENLTGIRGRFVVTGQPIWDLLADSDSLHESVQGKEVRILCAVPQWGEHHQLPWEVHMRFIESLMRILGGCGGKVVLSLHPKAPKARYLPLAKRFGLAISEEPLISELKLTDIFVASWSSTIRWAAMLGIASINLDWASQSYSLFEKLRSMPVAQNPSDLERELTGLIQDPEKRMRIGKALRSEAAIYGSIDGRACSRVIDLVSDVLANPKEKAHG